MAFKKACQEFVNLTHKFYSSANSLSRIAHFRVSPKSFQKYSRFSNILLASTALGLTVYVANRRTTLCEVIENTERKKLNTSSYVYKDAISKSRDLLQRMKDEVGVPGIVVGVSINGKTVWTEGLGYADVENRVLCSADTVMRIASISKSITMTAVAKLWEQGKLDLDKPVQDYVPYFPSKTFDGKPVTITCRQLVSHLGGIRHYHTNTSGVSKKIEKGSDDKLQKSEKSELERFEYYIKEHYKDVASALDIFKDDPLITKPGSKFYYTTYGWTLISAIVEAASKEQFSIHMTKLFKSLGMSTTYIDANDVLIYHRSRNYMKDKTGKLVNSPYVDNSYKLAGGGMLSTVGDLLQFGNAMLYSLQFKPSIQDENIKKQLFESEKNIENGGECSLNHSTEEVINFIPNKQVLPGYLSAKTVETMWTPVADATKTKYGMGWFVIPEKNECLFCEFKKFCIFHTGEAVGASSVLLILPQKAKDDEMNELNEYNAPNGVIVTILSNLHSLKLSETALKIAEIFDNQS